MMESTSRFGARVRGPIEREELISVWPKIESFISDALARDGWKSTLDSFLIDVADGVLGVYVVEDEESSEVIGFVAAEVQEYPQTNVFHLAYCGGVQLWRWAELIGSMEAEGARRGCQIVRISGRPGWGRVFPDYREVFRAYERRIVVEQ